MNGVPLWLPQQLRFDGDWERLLAQAYSTFVQDFKTRPPRFRDRPVKHDDRIGPDGKEEGFWHIVSQDDRDTEQRLPDIARCERVPWIRPTIVNSRSPAISLWRNDHKRRKRVLLWLERLDYLIVLEERPEIVVLLTAYCTDRKHTRRKLRQERADYQRKQAPP